jgi:hypothetical protein
MTSWTDFSDAEEQASFDLIPPKTLAKVRMTLKPGGYDNPNLGWTGGYATRNTETGSAYLNAEFVVLEGPYAKRKIWNLIGLHSEKGPEWANMGRSFLRAVLSSARGIHPKDTSPQAQNALRIRGFVELDGIEFVARIDIEKDQRGDDRNAIRTAILPDHREYVALMGSMTGSQAFQPSPAFPASSSSPAPAVPARPSWAQ